MLKIASHHITITEGNRNITMIQVAVFVSTWKCAETKMYANFVLMFGSVTEKFQQLKFFNCFKKFGLGCV